MPIRTEAEKLAGMINVLGRKSLEAFRRATIRDALLAITPRQPSQSLIDGMIAVYPASLSWIAANPGDQYRPQPAHAQGDEKEFAPFTSG